MVYDDDGQLLTATLMDYALPKAEMVPAIETVLVEVPSEHGAYGAKGVGEPPAIPGAAAVGKRSSRSDREALLEHPHQTGIRGHGASRELIGTAADYRCRIDLMSRNGTVLIAAYGGECGRRAPRR